MKKLPILFLISLIVCCSSMLQLFSSSDTSSSSINQKPTVVYNPDDKTTTRTNYNPDGSQDIKIYKSSDFKPFSSTYINQHGTITRTEYVNEDKTTTITIFHDNGKQTIEHRDINNCMISSQNLNPQGKPTYFVQYGPNGYSITYHNDGTQQTIRKNKDGTTTIIDTLLDGSQKTLLRDAGGKNISEIVTNNNGSKYSSIDWNSDGSKLHTDYFYDGSQTKALTDQNLNVSYTHIDADGGQTNCNDKLKTAWHESCHAAALIFNRCIDRLAKATIKQTRLFANGCIIPEYTYRNKKNVTELEHQIMMLLSGGIGNQMAFGQKMLTNPNDILHFFKSESCRSDMEQAREAARKIIEIENAQKAVEKSEAEQINDIIIRLYPRAYQTIIEHKPDIKKVVDALFAKKELSGDEIYEILDAHKPLTDIEQGPLPLSLIEDYNLRGYGTRFKNPNLNDINHYSPQDSELSSGGIVRRKHYYNGNLAVEIFMNSREEVEILKEYNPDGILTEIMQNNPDGTHVKTIFNNDATQTIQNFDANYTLISEQRMPQQPILPTPQELRDPSAPAMLEYGYDEHGIYKGAVYKKGSDPLTPLYNHNKFGKVKDQS